MPDPKTDRPRGRRGRWAVGLALGAIALAGLAWPIWGSARESALKDQIRRASEAGRLADVEAGLVRWLQARPDDGDAWEWLGGLRLDRGLKAEAREALGRVGREDRGWAHARTLIGEIDVEEGDLPAAEAAFRAAAAADRRAVAPLERLASLLVLERRPAEARDTLGRLHEIGRDPRHLADRGLVARAESETRDLDPKLESYLRRTPDDPWVRRAWGLYLVSRGRTAEALPHLRAAASAFRDDPIGRFALAEARIAAGDETVDLDVLGPRPDRPVDAARWWVLRGRLAEARGLDDEALASFRRAVEADPNSADARHRLGQALRRRGDRDGAKAMLDAAQSIGARDDALARELRRAGREGFDVPGLVRLGTLSQDAGRPGEARDWFDLARRRDPQARVPDLVDSTGPTPADSGAEVALSRPVLVATPEPVASASPKAPTRSGPERRATIRFEESARRSGIDYRYTSGETPALFIADTMGGGVGLIDYDDDGWLDLYLIDGCPLPVDPATTTGPNRLYRNRGDGTFEDVTARAGVAGHGYGMGCAVADYDGDGKDDLYVTGFGRSILYRNRGEGTFEDVTARAGVGSDRWTTAAGFGDLDGDGDLDLYVATYVAADPLASPECRDRLGRPIHCQPERFSAQRDHLFRNNGDGTFTDVAREAGVEAPEGRGLGLAIADFDDDGRLDLFIANDGTANFLFRNLGGLRFEEVAGLAGAATDADGRPTASMGVVADDLDGDGRVDLFHTNFINQSSTFRRNLGGGQFADATLAANLSAPTRFVTGFGAVAIDVDADGASDLFLANGHTDDQPWFNTPMAEPPQLFLNRGRGRFELAGVATSPYFARPVVGRGAAAGDLDGDGRVDLVVVHRDAPVALLRNATEGGGHTLGLRLRGGPKSGSTPVGARVVCRAGGRTITRWLTGGTGYLAAHDPRLWLGLGGATVVDRLEVRWPSGAVQAFEGLKADRVFEVREGGEPVDRTVTRSGFDARKEAAGAIGNGVGSPP